MTITFINQRKQHCWFDYKSSSSDSKRSFDLKAIIIKKKMIIK